MRPALPVTVLKYLNVLQLQKEGFTDAIIDRFFKPFLGGIFFDKDLNVTSRLFEFVMRMLASGENSLPANGIGAISEQLAAALPAGSIRTGQSRFVHLVEDQG